MDQWSHSNWDPYWNQSSGVYYDIYAESVSNVGAIPNSNLYPQMITNADQGTVVSWGADTPAYCASATSNTAGSAPVCNVQVAAATTFGLATTSGGSLASSKTTNLPGQIGPINPILQAQDGTSVGIVFTTTQSSMIAFDSSGNVKWSVPNDYPYIATADGGVVGASGITYDNNGRATDQIGLQIQSWHGNGYRYGSVLQVVPTLTNIATTLWAQVGGSPSGSGTAARPWDFKLVWQNAFSLYPNNPRYLPNLSTDITFQAATIKSAALAALKKAYAKYPVRVSEGADDSTGDNRANVVNGVNVGKGGVSCGLSKQFKGSHDSNVYYLANMEQAQWAPPIVLNTSQDVQRAAKRVDLMNAIGTGIGNNAAHEIAHQFLLDEHGMDDSSLNTYNGQGCDGLDEPWVYTGVGTDGAPIHWENVTDQGLQDALKSGGPK